MHFQLFALYSKFRLLAWVLVFGEKKEIIPQLDGAVSEMKIESKI